MGSHQWTKYEAPYRTQAGGGGGGEEKLIMDETISSNFATYGCKPLIFQTCVIWSNRIHWNIWNTVVSDYINTMTSFDINFGL